LSRKGPVARVKEIVNLVDLFAGLRSGIFPALAD
jgi:hypothetical protein